MPRVDVFPDVDQVLHNKDDFIGPYLSKCACSVDFAEALTYCGQALGNPGGDNWANLYRAYEVASDHFGGDHALVGTVNACSKSELDRFKRTVNHQEAIGRFSRHARSRCIPPPNPMDFITAVKFVLAVMAAWFAWKE